MYATTLRKDDAFEIDDWAVATPSLAASAHVAGSGYAQTRRLNPIAIAAIIAIHAGLFLVFMNLGFGHTHHQRERLKVDLVPVNIAPPPPPKAMPQPQQKVVQTPIVAPPQIVQTTPVTPPPVVATPAPQTPAPPAPVAAPVAAPVIAAAGPVAIGKLAPMPGNPPLKYPMSSRMKHEEGVVRLRLIIGTSGGVQEIAVEQSSGFDALDKAAVEVVRRWRFIPPTRDGVPVEGVGIFPAAFKLA